MIPVIGCQLHISNTIYLQNESVFQFLSLLAAVASGKNVRAYKLANYIRIITSSIIFRHKGGVLFCGLCVIYTKYVWNTNCELQKKKILRRIWNEMDFVCCYTCMHIVKTHSLCDILRSLITMDYAMHSFTVTLSDKNLESNHFSIHCVISCVFVVESGVNSREIITTTTTTSYTKEFTPLILRKHHKWLSQANNELFAYLHGFQLEKPRKNTIFLVPTVILQLSNYIWSMDWSISVATLSRHV